MMKEKIWISCDNCKLQWICRVKHGFEEPLLFTRHVTDDYPQLAKEFYELLAKNCNNRSLYLEEIESEEDD